MTDIHIEQTHDMLHTDLFNSIYLKSNNEKMTSPKDTNLKLNTMQLETTAVLWQLCMADLNDVQN